MLNLPKMLPNANCNPSLPYEVTGIFGFRFQFEVGPVTRILG